MFSDQDCTDSLPLTKIELKPEIAKRRRPMFFYHPDVENIGNHRFYSEGWKGYVEGGANCIAKIVVKYVNSPLLWKHGIRKQDNFKLADWIGLDIDDGLPLDDALEKFKDYIHVIATTKSHQQPKGTKPPCDRYRVFLKLENTCRDLNQYKYIVQKIGKEIGADDQAFDGARMFQPCKIVKSVKYHGRLVKLETPPPVPSDDEKWRKARLDLEDKFRGKRHIPQFIQDWLTSGCEESRRNMTCFKIGIYLGRSGFSESEIVTLIMSSPIPVSQTYDVTNEVTTAVRRGMQRA